MRRVLETLLIGGIAIGAGACTLVGGTGGTGGTLDGTSWRLTDYVSSGTLITVEPGYIVDATFTASQVSGFSGCNTYTAPITVSGASLTVGQIATSGRLCKMAIPIEQDYLAALATTASFTADQDDDQVADSLTMFDGAGKAILVYVAASADPLEGTWTVTGFNNGNEAVVSPADGTTLSATFTPDGQVAGSAGCNDYQGRYALEGTSLTVGPVTTTERACDETVMDQEAQFLTALQTPTAVEISGPTVTLRASDGATQVVLAPQ